MKLADCAAGGDPVAWKALVAQLWPSLIALVRSNRSMGPLKTSEDDVREVVVKVIEKLGDHDGHGLKLHRSWRGRHPDKTFQDWLRIVVKNAIRDHVREQRGPTRRPEPSNDPGVKRLLNEFATSPALDRLGVRPPMTAAQTARQLLEFATSHLAYNQLRALTSWIAGASFTEIQQEIGLATPDEATRLLRAAVAVLRREFADGR